MAATCGAKIVDYSTTFINAFAIIGGLTVACIVIKGLIGIFRVIRTFVLARIPDLKKYGEWAVVTGATDGIGKAYAQELARSGMNVVLVSRTLEKLQDVAAELEAINSGIKTKIIVADFTQGWALKDTLSKGLEGLDIGVLVNNIGMGYPYPEFFLDIPDLDKVLHDILHCNVTSALLMTRVTLPGMVQRKRGLVITVSSGSGFMPTPMLTVYSATKAFVDFFSEGMNFEYHNKGVHFQSVLPFFVATKLSRIRRSSLIIPSATAFVRSALATVGRTSRTTGYLPHEIQRFLGQKLPLGLVRAFMMKQFLASRRKALKNKKAE